MRNRKADKQRNQIPATLKPSYEFACKLQAEALGSDDVNTLSTANTGILRVNDALDLLELNLVKRCFLDANGKEVVNKIDACFE